MTRITLILLALAVAAASGRQAKRDDPEPPAPKTTLVSLLKKYPKDEDAVENLFRMTLGRKPTAEESSQILAFVARGTTGREAAYRDIHYAVTNSAEYATRQKGLEKAKQKAAKPK